MKEKEILDIIESMNKVVARLEDERKKSRDRIEVLEREVAELKRKQTPLKVIGQTFPTKQF